MAADDDNGDGTSLFDIFFDHQKKSQFPQSQSLPSGSFHKPLILIHQRTDRMKTTITEN